MVNMMLIDKSYYDYDFEMEEGFIDYKDWADTIKSDEEVADMLSGFGFGKPKTEEELQEYIIKQENYGC